MNRRKFLFGSAVALGGTTLIGSGAFSRVESQRDVTIEVVGDEDAYLYLEYGDIEIGCEAEQQVLVTVGNQLKDDIENVDFDLDVEVSGDGVSIENLQIPDRIELGERAEITADLICDGAEGAATVSFEISVSGNGASVKAHRSETFTIQCECLANLTGISFIAFCGEVDVESIEITRQNGQGEPVEVEWSTAQDVDEVVLQGGREWYLYEVGGANSGMVRMDSPPADQYAHADDVDYPGGDNQVKFSGDTYRRCPRSPCDGEVGTKIDESNGTISVSDAESTQSTCPE